MEAISKSDPVGHFTYLEHRGVGCLYIILGKYVVLCFNCECIHLVIPFFLSNRVFFLIACVLVISSLFLLYSSTVVIGNNLFKLNYLITFYKCN